MKCTVLLTLKYKEVNAEFQTHVATFHHSIVICQEADSFVLEYRRSMHELSLRGRKQNGGLCIVFPTLWMKSGRWTVKGLGFWH